MASDPDKPLLRLLPQEERNRPVGQPRAIPKPTAFPQGRQVGKFSPKFVRLAGTSLLVPVPFSWLYAFVAIRTYLADIFARVEPSMRPQFAGVIYLETLLVSTLVCLLVGGVFLWCGSGRKDVGVQAPPMDTD